MALENIAHELAERLKQGAADYIEARLEESQTSHITYRGKELESIGRSEAVGGNVRAMVKGGWGFVSFNSLKDLPGRVEMAIRQAGLVGREKSQLAAVPPVVDRVLAGVEGNPVAIPLAEKKVMLDEYNEIIWRNPEIQTATIGYGDSRKRTIFLSSLGSHIEQERLDITLRVAAVAARDGDVQQAGLSVGSRGDLKPIRQLHREVERLSRHVVALLSAPKAKGGEYTVVLDPVLAGVFVHEAFGHLSESDFVYENERLRELMTLGKQFGRRELNIVDTATLPGLRGSYKYDDEGVPATRTYLIREGKLVGRLHSRETAAKMKEPPTGNARAVSYRYPEGIYVKNWYGGTTSMEMFTFSAGEAYMIRNGQIAEALRPVVLTGNVFDTLNNIDAIGNDLDMNQGGGCGKGGQMPLPVSNGSPHIRLRRCLVGGR